MEKQFDKNLPFYNVKVLRNFVSYLKTVKGWDDANLDELFAKCGTDRSFLDADDNWFGQDLADRFNLACEEATNDPDIAYKVGRFSTTEGSKGIAGRIIQGLFSPQSLFSNIPRVAQYYSKGAVYEPILITRGRAILRAKPVPECNEKPYQCLNRLGMLEAGPHFFNCSGVKASHPKCYHQGDEYCEYEITWGEPWRYKPTHAALAAIAIGILTFQISPLSVHSNLLLSVISTLGIWILSREINVSRLADLLKDQNLALEESVETLDRRHEESLLLRSVVDMTTEMMPTRQLCETTANLLRTVMRYDRSVILLIDPLTNTLNVEASAGFSDKEKKAIQSASFKIRPDNTDGFFIRVVNTRQPLLIRDVKQQAESLSPKSRQLVDFLGTESLIAVPILFKDSTWGVISVENKRQLLGTNDLQLIKGLADHFAVAISNAKNYQSTLEALEHTQNLEKKERELRELFQKFVPNEMRLDRADNAELRKVQRRTLSIMFIDIADFTTLSEGISPEEVTELLNEYIEVTQPILDRHKGRINKLMGDGMLVYFDPRETNSLVAALEVVNAIPPLNSRLKKRALPKISIGIGIHRGVCTLGNIGNSQRLDYTIIGDAVNTASRIQGLTRDFGPNTICFSDTLKPEVDSLNFSPRGKAKLKGLSREIEVFQLLSDSSATKPKEAA